MTLALIFILVQFRRLRHETLAQFVKEFIAIVEKPNAGAGAIGIKSVFDVLKLKYEVMIAVLDALFKSGITAKLKEQDRFRDGFVHGLMILIRSFLRHSDATKRDAATELMIVFDHYKNLSRKTYNDESAAMDDLIRELKSAKFSVHVTTLGLGALVALLVEANEKFFTLVNERYEEEKQRPTVPMKEARAEVEEALHAVLNRAEAIATLNGVDATPEFAEFVKDYNLIATRYKHLLAIEKGRRKAAASNEGDEGNDEDEGYDGDEGDGEDEGYDGTRRFPATRGTATRRILPRNDQVFSQ
ncbi:MAG: DUF6261 family protein [Odoribacteraceae bacterium]|jgi:hypothetical protein|nr:DUF6261 family protein [Odoribacteraceae bacterium]